MSTSITEEKRKLLMGKTVEDISEWMEGTLGKKPVPAKKKRRLYAFRSAYKSLHGKLKKNEGNDSYSLLSKIDILEKRKIQEGHPEKSVKGYSWIVRRTLAQYADHLHRATKEGGVYCLEPGDDLKVDVRYSEEDGDAPKQSMEVSHVQVSMTTVGLAALQMIAAQDGKSAQAWCEEKVSEAIIVALNSMSPD